MNTYKGYSKMWVPVLLLALVAFVAGCGENDDADAPSFARAITAYSLDGVAGTIDETAKTISVTMPYGTNVTALVATFSTSGASVKIGTVEQASGTTANDFSNPVIYTVTAADGTTANYTVTVTVASRSAKAITAYLFVGYPASPGTIDEGAKTISVTLPYGTSVTALVATFATTGVSVKVGTTTQITGTTANDFSNPVTYTVTAANGTTAIYTVTVTVASSSAKAITAYSIASQASSTIIGSAISVTMPYGTDVTALVASFSTSGALVTVGTTTQMNGSTPNDFTSPVDYTVHAADGTTAIYTVTVTVALNSAKAITAYSIASMTSSTIIASAITVTMPYSTPSVTALVASFTTSTGASVMVVGVPQTSGTTPNDFSSPVTYTVTAEDGTSGTYIVTVIVAPAAGPAICTGTTGTMGNNCVDLGTAANYVILAESAVTSVPTSNITGDVGLFPITGASYVLSCPEVTGVIYSADAAGPACKVTDATGLNIAVNDKLDAYNDGFGRIETSGAYLNIGSPAGTLDAGVSPLAPGVYVWTSGISIPVNLTLSGNATDVWIFKVGGAVALDAQVLLSGGALPQNIFWIVSGGVTVGAGAHIEGVVLAAGDITLITGSSAQGRLLSATQVVLQVATVTQPAP